MSEYLVWRVYDGAFDWFVLQQEEYHQLQPNAQDIFYSQIFPGLWLAKTALLKGDLATVLNTLQQGIATAEHQNFVKQLDS